MARVRKASMTDAISIPIGQRAKHVSQDEQVQMMSLSRISSPAPSWSLLMISEGGDTAIPETVHPLEHFLHWKQTLRSTSDISWTILMMLFPVFPFFILIAISILIPSD
jgi:hypothetical protein